MANYTFKKEARMLTSLEYKKVFSNPVRVSSNGVTILAIINDNTSSRLGLVVPKKILKRAVWRNRVKRVVRESFRLSSPSFEKNADIVFIAKAGIKDINNQKLFELLDKLWIRLKKQLNKVQS